MEILNVYHEEAPAARFIGKRYGEEDRRDGGFGACWHQWFADDSFKRLEALAPYGWDRAYPEGLSYIGLMRESDGRAFEYWIGMFLPADTPVPEGMQHIDFAPWHMGVCWVKGTEPAIYQQAEVCAARLAEAGYTIWQGESAWLMLERYQCPRFTQRGEDGEVILDLIHRIGEPALAGGEAESTSPSDTRYCAACHQAFSGDKCPDCDDKGTPLQADDPILIGMLPARLRNAMQIAFSATEIPFTAIPTLGSGFTMAAGDIFETYTVYAPYERAQEAADAMESVLGHPPEKPGK